MEAEPQKEVDENATGKDSSNKCGEYSEHDVTPSDTNGGSKGRRIVLTTILEIIIIFGGWEFADFLSVHGYTYLASVCFFASLSASVVFVGFAIHQVWPRTRIIFSTCLACCVLIAIFIFLVSGNPLRWSHPPDPPLRTPTVAQENIPSSAPGDRPKLLQIERAYLAGYRVGSNYFGFEIDGSGTSRDYSILFVSNGPNIRVSNGVFMVNAVITDGRKFVRIADGSVSVPSDWDANLDDNGAEIINDFKHPVFQIDIERLKGKNMIATIGGIFVLQDGTAVAVIPNAEIETTTTPGISKSLLKFRRLFKYPSDQFPGQRLIVPSSQTSPPQ
jgi:cytochrome c oxidase subunit IV